MIKKIVKALPCYRDLRHSYLSYKKYGKLTEYLYSRFWLGSKIRRLGRPLDREIDTEQFSIHVVCCHIDVVQLLWALASWYRVVPISAKVYIHEDGSLTVSDKALISKTFPHSEIIDFNWATEQAMNKWLIKYPSLRTLRVEKREVFALKIVDPYFVSNCKYFLILDTDILWFRAPDEVLQTIVNYECPLFWQENKPCPYIFGDGDSLKEELLCHNSGFIYYEKADFNLNLLEEFMQKKGNFKRKFEDQPVYAYILGNYSSTSLLPKDRYIIKGKVKEDTIAKHYTAPRREKFWFEGVKFLQSQF